MEGHLYFYEIPFSDPSPEKKSLFLITWPTHFFLSDPKRFHSMAKKKGEKKKWKKRGWADNTRGTEKSKNKTTTHPTLTFLVPCNQKQRFVFLVLRPEKSSNGGL